MSERNYYVICDDNCKFPAMTKEEVMAAIAETTGRTPSDIDQAFITKIKEMNKNQQLKWWVGTETEYNAIQEKAEDTFYIITDSGNYEYTTVISDESNHEEIPTAKSVYDYVTNYVNATILSAIGGEY